MMYRLFDLLYLIYDLESFFFYKWRKVGDIFTIRAPGIGNITFAAHPEMVKAIFKAPQDVFDAINPTFYEPILGRHSLLLLNGCAHKEERKLLSSPFHGKCMRSFFQIIHDATLKEIDRWHIGMSINAQNITETITLDVIIHAIFGVTSPEKREKFKAVILQLTTYYSSMVVIFPYLRKKFFGLSPWDKFLKAKNELDMLLNEEIYKRKQGIVKQEDFLSLLITAKFSDGSCLRQDQLTDELRTMLIGGFETTAISLAWALYFVYNNPAIHRKLYRKLNERVENDTIDKCLEVAYLKAVCQETLRIHPSGPMAARKLKQDYTFGHHTISKGDSIAVPFVLLNHHPAIWHRPDVFNPERFINHKYSPYEFAPFGGGFRRCLGADFALHEMQIALTTIVKRVVMKPANLYSSSRKRMIIHNLTCGPKCRLPMQIDRFIK